MDEYNSKDIYLVVSKFTFELLLKQKNFDQLYALYSFYYYTSKWQQTNKIYATNNYTANALGWSENKVKMYRKKLIDLCLVKSIREKRKNGTFGKSYVQVRYVHSQIEYKEAVKKTKKVTTGQKNRPVVDLSTNALRGSNISALRGNNGKKKKKILKRKTKPPRIKRKRRTPEETFYNWIVHIIKTASQKHSKRKITPQQITNWKATISKFIETKLDLDTFQEKKDYIEPILIWYRKNTGLKFTPQIFSAKAFTEKFEQLEAAMKRDDMKQVEDKRRQRPTQGHYSKDFKLELKEREVTDED